MNAKRYIAFFTLILLWCTSVSATDADRFTASIFDMLTVEENAKIIIKTDLLTLMENRTKEDYQEATMTTKDGKVRHLKVRVRGKFRRRLCEMPPLKLKFSKEDLKAEGLSDMNEIKLVTACMDNKKANDWVVREHLAYQLFNNFSSVSLRSGLVVVVFQDVHVEKMELKMQCMLLEDIEELAFRTNSEEIERYGLEPDSLNTHQAALVSMFNYMIGNTDWEVSANRNVKFLKSKNDPEGKIFVVPYDFDFSGFVNTDYALPSSQTGLKTVRERFLMADGIPQVALKKAALILAAQQEQIYAVCSSKQISKNSQRDMKEFLHSFFEKLAAEDSKEMLEAPLMD